MKPLFFECGQCGHLHAIDLPWWIDCRDDKHRFSFDQLDARFGANGYDYETLDEQMNAEKQNAEKEI